MASIESIPEVVAEQGERLLLFRAGSRSCACVLVQVREIVPMRPVTRLPGAASWIRGLMNHRGALVPVADLSGRLGDRPADDHGRQVLVVEGAGKTYGLVVDQVQEVRAVPDDRRQPVTGDGTLEGAVSAMVSVYERPSLLLDLEALARQVLAG